ncbi:MULTISPECIES: NADP-dependent malic enzyme [unclassified Iodidimonas]|jgi:malate dehydrogenase (oxaloacetate-decarboxylating)(NADP+)|uniref:NADP-dependent malic enzyme n=1 Tax=unclassified Iodidimonas TaxID=2626145 RepID=UPI002482CBC5|nr:MULTISPECIES: NADP-dependent malic enzyme [unclassified Iodidimonas]
MSDTDKLYESALRYHRMSPPGKLAIVATKPLVTQRDLALAYSPGVAAACKAIMDDPDEAANLTARGNLVAVISNGSAVLGLGNIGPLASKPVMEGKAVLFKKFANIDCFDIEVDAKDPDLFCKVVAALGPTFGAINLEDIKAPECFIIEERLRKEMDIPVFHDDQHGTAIVAGAAIYNALKVVGKKIDEIRLVSTGGGAASLACLDLLVSMGLKRENVILCDIEGVVYEGRKEDMNPYKSRYARQTDMRTLDDAIADADVFLGLSAPKVLTPDMVKKMGSQPIIMALANPEPEIMPDLAREARPDAIIATGRSDFPNQVNNVLCYPFIFRGALDVGASDINEAMKIAAVKAIASLADKEVSDVVARAYEGEPLRLGPDYLIPKPFDSRLMTEVAPAVARAAMESGVARRPIEDFDAYLTQLNTFVFRSGNLMQPIFERARSHKKRLLLAEGEEERVLRAAQALLDENLGDITLVGRPAVVESRIEKLGLRMRADRDFELVNPQNDARYGDYWRAYHLLMERKGVSPDEARTVMRTNNTAIASLALKRGEADAMVCGSVGRFDSHLHHILDIVGLSDGVKAASALSVLMLSKGTFFLCDTFITNDPSAEEIAEVTMLAADEVRRFGLEPKVALLSHSNFGTSKSASSAKMRTALALLHEAAPDLEVEGEMHGDAAIDEAIRDHIFPHSRLNGMANLLVMPNLDSANIAYELLKVLGDGLPIGPLLLGTRKPAHIVTPSVTARGLLNIGALALVDAIDPPELRRSLSIDSLQD